MESSRQYTDEELNALYWAEATDDKPRRGPAYFASGWWWTSTIRARADRLEKLIPLLRLAADAMEREQKKDGTWNA